MSWDGETIRQELERRRKFDPPSQPDIPVVGLGDWTEQILSSVGITKDRYKAAKELFGLAPTCSCESRQAYLNKVSDWWRGV